MAKTKTTAGTATEITTARRHSPHGAPQRLYRLDPALSTADGADCDVVVVTRGIDSAYAFPGTDDGEICDITPLVVVPVPTARDAAVLATLGYRIAV